MVKGIGVLSRITPQRVGRIERLIMATSARITEMLPKGVLRWVVKAAAAVTSGRYAAIGVLVPTGG
jgi:hypothetical protein